MRIVIDIQALQTQSRFRGIGRYTYSFVNAIVRHCEMHEVVLVLSGLLPQAIDEITENFNKSCPGISVVVWRAPELGSFQNASTRKIAELVREAFLLQLRPDVILVASLFEGYGDSAICSIKRLDDTTPVVVILYDLIPLLNPGEYLDFDSAYKNYYMERVGFLKKADLCLAISEYSKNEAMATLDIPAERVVAISSAVEENFARGETKERALAALFGRLKIRKRYIFYVGGSDPRKNLERLIAAYALLPVDVRRNYQLVFGGAMPDVHVLKFMKSARELHLDDDDLVFTGYIGNDDLVELYKQCWLFVFPSFHEGFGLPALEAMLCGAPVIGSNVTSLPEVIGAPEALFPPRDVYAIADKMSKALTDQQFRDFLVENAALRARCFSWDTTAEIAIRAIESLAPIDLKRGSDVSSTPSLFGSLASELVAADENFLVSLSKCLVLNEVEATRVSK